MSWTWLNTLNSVKNAPAQTMLVLLVFSGLTLAPAIVSRVVPSIGRRCVQAYGRALIGFTILSLLVHSFSLIMPQECPGTGTQNIELPNNAWCDIYLSDVDPTTYQPTNPSVKTLKEVDWTLVNFSVLCVGLTSLVALFIWCGLMLFHADGFVAREWGRNPQGRTKSWLRILGWTTALLMALLLLTGWNISTPFGSLIPTYDTSVTPQKYSAVFTNYLQPKVTPITVWTGALWSWLFLLGLLISKTRGDDPEPERKPKKTPPPPPKTALVRRQWEQWMDEKGFNLIRPTAAYRARHLNTPHITDMFRVMSPFSKATYWLHQKQFVHAIEAASRSQKTGPARAILMHVAHSSGKSMAVYEAAGLQVLDLVKHVLIVYPDQEQAARGLARFKDRLTTKTDKRIQVGDSEDARSATPPPIIVAAADWLPATLLPEHEEFHPFLSNLGLIIYEDIEALSGVKATNFSLVTRRLYRLLQAPEYDRRPVLGMTMAGVAQVETSGAEEFAQWLAGPCELIEAANRNEAPHADIYLYMLDGAPGFKDAEGRDELPPIAQAAWSTRAFRPEGAVQAGCPVNMHRHEMVTESDLKKPRWAGTPLDASDTSHKSTGRLRPEGDLKDPTMHHELDADMGKTWVHIRETSLRGFFSVPEHIEHGGNQLLPTSDAPVVWDGDFQASDHLVVLAPGMRCREFLQYLSRQWLDSTVETAPHEGQKRHTPWDQEFRTLGSRLVCGSPKVELMQRHIHAALTERPATQQELQDMFPWDGDIEAVRNDLERRGLLKKYRTRTLRPNERGEPEIEDPWVWSARPSLTEDTRTHLDAIGQHVVCLVERAGRTKPDSLQRLDAGSLLRRAYPGKLFFKNGRRYRVSPDAFAEVLTRVQSQAAATASAKVTTHHLLCENDDILAYTEPHIERETTRLIPAHARGGQEHQRVVEDFQETGGVAVRITRVQAELHHKHLGYREYRDACTGTTLEERLVTWQGAPLEMTIRCSALLVCIPRTDIAHSRPAIVTLRRMLSPALAALVHLEPELLDVEVVKHVNYDALGHGADPEADVLSGDDIGILIMDATGGDSGLLEALGTSPRRFIIDQLFRLVWLWATDLIDNAEDTISWNTIGTLNMHKGDDLVSPQVEEVRDLLANIIGDRAVRFGREQETNDNSDESEGVPE